MSCCLLTLAIFQLIKDIGPRLTYIYKYNYIPEIDKKSIYLSLSTVVPYSQHRQAIDLFSLVDRGTKSTRAIGIRQQQRQAEAGMVEVMDGIGS